MACVQRGSALDTNSSGKGNGTPYSTSLRERAGGLRRRRQGLLYGAYFRALARAAMARLRAVRLVDDHSCP